jgi:replicative DNA helicase
MKETKIITSSPEIEMRILGAMMQNNESASIGLRLAENEDFTDPKHKLILKAIRNVFEEKEEMSGELVRNNLTLNNELQDAGGMSYVMNVEIYSGIGTYIEAEFEDLKRLTEKRRLIYLLNSANNELKKDADPSKIFNKIEEGIRNNNSFKNQSGSAFEIKPYTLDDLQKELSQTKEGLKTGYTKLDEMVRIPNEAITLIGGRPSHGKTTFMLNMFLNLIEQYPEHHFYFFSYEETRQQIAVKLINILSGFIFEKEKNIINLEGYLRLGTTSFPEVERGKKKYQELVESGRLRIVSDPFYIQQLPAIVSSLKSKVPLGAVFIDYIQKIKNKQKFGTRQLELADTSNIILETAKSCSIPIILGAQLGRDRENKNKVKLDNLRECGDLEQDANLVLGLFNPSMEKAQEEQTQLTDQRVKLDITPLKNRNGIVNKKIVLDFDRPLLRITNEPEKK